MSDKIQEQETPMTSEKPERISKRMSRVGICSRRDAERMIAEGRVAVNGKKLIDPVCLVTSDDSIKVDGKLIPMPDETRVWRFHKPAGCLTSNKDEKGRATVFEILPENLPRVMTIGRLDMNTEGLLLLTNDGELARFLEKPDTGWTRRYRVRAFGRVNEAQLKKLKHGVSIDGVDYQSIEAKLEKEQGDNVWISVAIKEGKNREVRKVMEHLGLEVNRLIRISYGPFQLGNLDKKEVEEVGRKVLKASLGKKWFK